MIDEHDLRSLVEEEYEDEEETRCAFRFPGSYLEPPDYCISDAKEGSAYCGFHLFMTYGEDDMYS